jgi:hypothetical protein
MPNPWSLLPLSMMRALTTWCCLIAAALGAAAILLHARPIGSIVFYVSCVWMLGSIALSGAYKREYWEPYDRTLSEAMREDAAGRRPKTPVLGRITLVGAISLTVISAYLNYFV